MLEKNEGRGGLWEVFGVACVCVGDGEDWGRRLCGVLGVGLGCPWMLLDCGLHSMYVGD